MAEMQMLSSKTNLGRRFVVNSDRVFSVIRSANMHIYQ